MRIRQEIEWVHINIDLPEYTHRAGSDEFVMVLVDHRTYGVGESMYCSGVFFEPLIYGNPELMEQLPKDVLEKFHDGVQYWAYKPKGVMTDEMGR